MTLSRLHIVSGEPERELAAIRSILTSYERVDGLEHLIAVLHAHADRHERYDMLDTIGHSCRLGFLVLGDWVIDDRVQTWASFSLLLRPLLEMLGVRVIRLLGCSTASTRRSRDVLRCIAQATRCSVIGTTRYISRFDYEAAGLRSDELLADAEGRRPSAGPGLSGDT